MYAEKRAEVLEQGSDSDPDGDFSSQFRPAQALRAKAALQHRTQQVVAEEADAPQPHYAGECQQETGDGVAPPARVGEQQLAERAQLLLLGARLEPLLRLLQFPENHQGQGGGQGAHQKEVAPGPRDHAALLQAAQQDAAERGHHVAHGGEGLHRPQGVGARAVGYGFGYHGDAHGELPAHAQAAQKPVEVEIPHAHGEDAQPGEHGEEEDGGDHGSDAADAVAQYPEDHPAQSPADHEDRRGVTGLRGDGSGGGPAAQQIAHGGKAGQNEKLLGHGIEHPAHAGDAQHQPVVAVQLAAPGVLRRGRRIRGHEAAIVSELNAGRNVGHALACPPPFSPQFR